MHLAETIIGIQGKGKLTGKVKEESSIERERAAWSFEGNAVAFGFFLVFRKEEYRGVDVAATAEAIRLVHDTSAARSS